MFSHKEGVQVHRVKEQTGARQLEALLKELATKSDRGRLRLVLNCSDIRHLSHSVTMLLLSCLEVAMMGNGDVRLGAVSPTVGASLRQMGMADVFELHSTAEVAVQSFYSRPYSAAGMQDRAQFSVQDQVAA